MSIIVRPQVIGDTDQVWDVLTTAFADDGRVAGLAEALLDGPSRIALVAEADDQVVGHVQLSRSWLDTAEHLVDVLVLSPLGVAPKWQRQGIGSQLIKTALHEARQRRAPLVWLEGDPNLYPPFGFRRGAELGFRPPSERIPAGSFLVAPLPPWRPWMTGGLIYPDAFWVHDCVGPSRRSTE